MFFLVVLPLFIPGFLIFTLGMLFMVWPGVKDLVKKIREESFIKAIFSWDFFFLMMKVAMIAIISAVVTLGLLYVFFRRFIDFICSSAVLQLILAVGPLILEIVGYVLSVIGIGVPIVGIGIFFEIFSMFCDFMKGEWLAFILSAIGLIPVIGVPFGGGKSVMKIMKIIQMLT